MVALEAMREGCPVVASRETPWGCLEAAGAGRTADFDRPEEAARALAAYLDDGARAAAGRAARALYLGSFAPTVVAPRFAAWYASVLRRTE
jgi:glycosyltransferase involved in cell wall biosynthesis